jgi:site-specific recombinase XerD
MTVDEAIKLYQEHIRTYMAATSVKTYRSRLAFLSQRMGGATVDKVKSRHLTDVVVQYRAGRGNNSARLFVTAVKEVFRFIHNEGYINSNPALYLRAPRATRHCPRNLAEWQVKNLLRPVVGDWRDQRNQTMLVVLLYTGLRREEVANLKWDDIYLSKQGSKLVVRGKGDKVRVIPLHKEVDRYLLALFKERRSRRSPYVFSKEDGGRLHTYTINCIFRRWVSERKGVECTPHQLRHTFATRLISRGVTLEMVRDLLGHDSVRTTELYVAMDAERLRAAVNVL